MKKFIIILVLACSCAPKALPTVQSETKKSEEREHNRKRGRGLVVALLFIAGCAYFIPEEI